MDYITSIYALNIPCSLNTTADWHFHALDWNNYTELNSNSNPLKDYGLEKKKIDIGQGLKEYIIANHIRAFFDCIYLHTPEYISDFKFNYLITDEYEYEIMDIAYHLLKNHSTEYNDIDRIIHKIFGRKWKIYKENKNDK